LIRPRRYFLCSEGNSYTRNRQQEKQGSDFHFLALAIL
jgi:hypothetical protein